MRKITSLLAVLVLALATSVAVATEEIIEAEPNNVAVGADYGVGTLAGQAEQTITVDIPTRYAVHITRTSWSFNLNPYHEVDNPEGIRPLGSTDAVEGCFMVPKVVAETLETPQDFLDWLEGSYVGGTLIPTNTYPAIVDTNTDGRITDEEKGYLVCVITKIVQKFANEPGWQLSVDVNFADSAGAFPGDFGQFAIADFIGGLDDPGFQGGAMFDYDELGGPGFPIASGTGTTGGWLDDLILEGFYFDGTEVAGEHSLSVTYTLSDL